MQYSCGTKANLQRLWQPRRESNQVVWFWKALRFFLPSWHRWHQYSPSQLTASVSRLGPQYMRQELYKGNVIQLQGCFSLVLIDIMCLLWDRHGSLWSIMPSGSIQSSDSSVMYRYDRESHFSFSAGFTTADLLSKIYVQQWDDNVITSYAT